MIPLLLLQRAKTFNESNINMEKLFPNQNTLNKMKKNFFVCFFFFNKKYIYNQHFDYEKLCMYIIFFLLLKLPMATYQKYQNILFNFNVANVFIHWLKNY